MEELLAVVLKQMIEDSKNYNHCMTLYVCNDSQSVDLILDTGVSYYGEWIKGEGGDICLYRCRETRRVVGVHLPLMRNNLSVWHDGPLRINNGFVKTDENTADI